MHAPIHRLHNACRSARDRHVATTIWCYTVGCLSTLVFGILVAPLAQGQKIGTSLFTGCFKLAMGIVLSGPMATPPPAPLCRRTHGRGLQRCSDGWLLAEHKARCYMDHAPLVLGLAHDRVVRACWGHGGRLLGPTRFAGTQRSDRLAVGMQNRWLVGKVCMNLLRVFHSADVSRIGQRVWLQRYIKAVWSEKCRVVRRRPWHGDAPDRYGFWPAYS
jgi:hypothetical protein